MHQVPHQIWKDINEQIGLKAEWTKLLVSADDVDIKTSELYRTLESSFERNALSAFFSFGFLYLEHDAITKYINKFGLHDLRSALPEILSKEEVWGWYKLERNNMVTINKLEEQQLELLLYRAIGDVDEFLWALEH